jgi:hypothetical protein
MENPQPQSSSASVPNIPVMDQIAGVLIISPITRPVALGFMTDKRMNPWLSRGMLTTDDRCPENVSRRQDNFARLWRNSVPGLNVGLNCAATLKVGLLINR